MNIWEQSFDDLRRPYLEEKKGDGNLANNYPPYDKVTRGDIIAGALGQDQMGGKKKKKNVKEAKNGGVSKAGELKFHKNLDTLVHDTFGKRKDEKKKACEHSDWRSDLNFFTEEDCGCDGPIKPKKGVKNKITINPDLKTEQSAVNAGPSTPVKNYDGKILQNFGATRIGAVRLKPVKENQQLQEKPGDGYIGPTPIPNPIRLAQDAVDAYNRKQQKTVDAVNKVLPGSASMSASYFNKGPSAASKRYLGLQNSYEPEGEMVEVAPPGAKYERMVKHVKKNYPKSKEGIAFATAWKQYNKAKNEEFAGNYEGPLYAPHPDIEEGYKEIDKDKENRMYRRAGNLARTAVSSKGKKKEEAQTKSSKIVSAITRQKEKERFDRIGQSPTHNEAFVDPEHGEAPSGRTPLENVSDHPKASVRKTAVKGFKKQMSKEYGGKWKSRSSDPVKEALESELDYYLGEALRPASERMKRTQTAAGRKKQEQQREKKSKLEAEADKILAGFSKKGTGTAKTKAAPKPEAPEANRTLKSGKKKDTLAMKANKAMSEQHRPPAGWKPYGGGPDDKPTVKIPLSGVMQGGWKEKEKKKKETK